MIETCFYCSDEIEDTKFHHVSFISANQERDETLCEECYKEWLHGIKG
ncbi:MULTISPECIES: hypothetical protein [Bacillaceae]